MAALAAKIAATNGGAAYPAAATRLEHFDRQSRSDPVETEGLSTAAAAVITAVQQLLREEGPHFWPPYAAELWRRQDLAIDALRYLYGDSGAKETVLELTDGEPLAICVGSNKRRKIQVLRRLVIGVRREEVEIGNPGCYSSFLDATRPSGRMWPRWCPNCRSSNGKCKPGRDYERFVRRRYNDNLLDRPPRVWTARRWDTTS